MVICRGDGFMHFVGYKKEGSVKNVLQVEILDVDEQNKYGESLIYVATYFCEIEVVLQLISFGANPNIQNMDGNTALHAAAYIGNVKLLNLLVESGGDLRIVNSDGQRPCQLFKDIKSHQRIKAFEQSVFNEFTKHIRFKAGPILIPQRKPSIFDNLTRISKAMPHNQVRSYFGVQSGFGNYFCQNNTVKGVASSIKVILNSKNIEADSKTKLTNFSCGDSTKMSSKLWNNYPVSVKVMDSLEDNTFDSKRIGLTNQAIKEANILGCLRHPNILLLMAVNLIVDDLDPSVIYQLVFERSFQGTLYHRLHIEKQEIEYSTIIIIINQIIDALTFCHSQQIIHCSLSSNSIFMVNARTAKLGNFENSMDLKTQELRNKSKCLFQKWNSFNFQIMSEGTLYKWLAPEILCDNGVIGVPVDIYGLAITIWELFTGDIPHLNRSYKHIIRKYSAPFADQVAYRIPENLMCLLQQSFSTVPLKRPSLYKIRSHMNELNQEFPEEVVSEISHRTKECDPKIVEHQIEMTNIFPIMYGQNNNGCSTSSSHDKSSSTTQSKSRLNRKSISLNCLTRSKRDSPFPWMYSTYSTIGNKAWYRDLAAIPNHNDSEVEWKYPSPLTEVSVEGRGNLSNETHRRSIVRGMKPASHQTGLSTSQTNICDLIGTADLIKTFSKGSLNKCVSSESSYTENCLQSRRQLTNRQRPVPSPVYRRVSPLGAKIANLVKKYESSESHPYSSSNCSTPKPSDDNKFHSPPKLLSTTNKENISRSPALPFYSVKQPTNFFPSLVSREKQEWSSTTDEENLFPKISKSKTSGHIRKAKCFGDASNKYC